MASRRDSSHGNDVSDSSKNEGTSEMFHPVDKGWAWLIMLGSFGVHFMSMGYQRSFGVLFVAFQEKFESSSAMTSAISGAQAFAYCFLTLLVMNYVVKRVSVRTVCIIGALLQFLSVAASSLVPNTAWLIVTEGIMFVPTLSLRWTENKGLRSSRFIAPKGAPVLVVRINLSNIQSQMCCGHALLYCPTLLILSQYFESRRPIATSLASCGASVGGIAFPYITRILLDNYALQGTLLLLSGMLLQQLIFVVVYTPPSNYQPPKKYIFDSIDTESLPNNELPTYANKEGTDFSQLLSPEKENTKDSVINREMKNLNTSLIKEQTSPLSISKSHECIPTSKLGHIFDDRSITRSHQLLSCESHTTRPGQKHLQNVSIHLDGQSIEQINASLPCLLFGDIPALNKQFCSAHDSHEHKHCDFQKQNSQQKLLKELLLAKSDYEHNHHEEYLVKDYRDIKDDESKDHMSATSTRSSGSTFCSVPSLMKLPSFWLLVIFFSGGVIGAGNPAVYIPPLSKERGLTEEDGSFFLMMSSLVEMVGRLIPGLILHFNLMRPSVLIIFPLIICGTMYHLTPFFIDFASILSLALIYGLFSSSFWSLQTLVVIDVLGLDNLASSIGFYAIFMGFASGVSFPVSGALKDISGTYSSTFHFFGASFYLAAAAIVLLQFIIIRDAKKDVPGDVEKKDAYL